MWNITPLLGTTFYIYVSQLLKSFFKNPSNQKIAHNSLQYFSITHNAALASFSFYTFTSLCKIIAEQGIIPGHAIYMSQPYVKTLIFWFYLSKYYEYFDTFLLYVKGREPIFLQKYHHVGAVICWHLCYKYDVDMIIFGTILNSGVHSVMYAYYLMTLLKINIRGMRMYITSGQMAQLIGGGAAGLYFYYPPVETARNYGIIVFFNLYIAGLVYLFGQFMVVNYFSKSFRPAKILK
jgi:GNS1/SUR4 family